MTRYISNSEVQTFKECRRKWWLAWYRGLRRVNDEPTGPLRSGTRVHKALEVLYVPQSHAPGDPMVELARIANEDLRAYEVGCRESGWEPDPDVLKEFHKALDLERAMVEGYLEWLEETGADAEYEVIAPEQELVMPSSIVFGRDVARNDDVALIGKLDVRLRRVSDGARLFMDHKTAASLTDALKTIKQDEQMLLYHVLEMAYIASSDDERCVGALYNMLKKVKRTARAKPPFFRRELILHNDHEIESFKVRLLTVIHEMLFVEQSIASGAVDPTTFAYPRPNRDCSWKCEFHQVCPMFDDGSRAEDMLASQFTERDTLDRYAFSRETSGSST